MSPDALVRSGQRGLRVAIDKALELEYELPKLLLVMTQKEDGGWEIYFKPRNPKQRGGGLTVHTTPTGDLERIQRWR